MSQLTGVQRVTTCARRIYSFNNGFAGCSNESSTNVSGDAVSRRLSNFDISSKLCVRLCDRLLVDDIITIPFAVLYWCSDCHEIFDATEA